MHRKGKKSSFENSGSFGPDEYWEELDPITEFRKKFRMSWAALLKCVYEIDPLKCPKCGGTMKIISFIEKRQTAVIENILRHCGMWKDTSPRRPRAPPIEFAVVQPPNEPATLDYDFFSSLAS